MGKIIVPGLGGLGKFPIPDLRPGPIPIRIAPNGKKVLLGMPFGRPMDLEPIQAWVDLIIHAVLDPSFTVLARYTRTAYLDLNRDNIVKRALETECEAVLMIDTDMSYPPLILETLVSRDKDVIGVPYYTSVWNEEAHKSEKVAPVIFDYDKKRKFWHQWPKVEQKEPFRVDAVGTGIMLIKTKVFKKIDAPWFPFFVYQGKQETRIMGEDLGFCIKCMAKGFEVWVDPTFGDDIKHWKTYGYSKKDCTEK